MRFRRRPAFGVVVMVAAALVAATVVTAAPAGFAAPSPRLPAVVDPRGAPAPPSALGTQTDSFHDATSIITGPDGNVWFAARGAAVWRMTPSGVVAGFS